MFEQQTAPVNSGGTRIPDRQVIRRLFVETFRHRSQHQT
jgi:hypothetical protein